MTLPYTHTTTEEMTWPYTQTTTEKMTQSHDYRKDDTTIHTTTEDMTWPYTHTTTEKMTQPHDYRKDDTTIHTHYYREETPGHQQSTTVGNVRSGENYDNCCRYQCKPHCTAVKRGQISSLHVIYLLRVYVCFGLFICFRVNKQFSIAVLGVYFSNRFPPMFILRKHVAYIS